jgi:hypothetical protein
MNEQQNLPNDPSATPTRQPKTMTEAALAANRANAQRSTGPRTEKGNWAKRNDTLRRLCAIT